MKGVKAWTESQLHGLTFIIDVGKDEDKVNRKDAILDVGKKKREREKETKAIYYIIFLLYLYH